MRKKKVAVISIWDIDNYGNRLQNYALGSAIRHMGHDAVTVKMWPQKRIKRIFQWITNYDVSWARLLIEKMRHHDRKYHFLQFERTNIKKDRHFYHDHETRAFINRKFDAFVVGSDQVWNPVFLNERYYFAEFADENKITASYAASLGVSELSKEKEEQLISGVKNLKYVTVREEAAADMIEKCGVLRPQVVVDPTMLIDVEEWEKLEKKPDYASEDYLLLYYLGDISEKRQQLLVKMCEENHLKMIRLNDPSDRAVYAAGPAEFLSLIHNAKCMCTDSFHGCVFSILYNTPFYVFERENSEQKMNSRIDTLLSTFALEDRKLGADSVNADLHCDFTRANERLAEKRKEGYDFLKKVLD